MKARTIELGTGPNGPVLLDLDILLRTRGYVSASSGGGKSHLLRRLIEEICPYIQCLVLDWEGEFSTLRKKFPFVLVGEGGETPAHPHTAAQVALTLLKLGTSAVCDLYELKGKGRHEFVRNFVAAMVSAPKELWHPVVIIIDEAHYLCPENGYGESVAKDAIIDLCNLGRKRGFCPILATQRASKVSKNAVEPLQNFLIGLTMPDDHKRVTDTFKVAPGAPKREFEKALMTLTPGQFFVRGAAIGNEEQLIQVGDTQTQPPPTGSAAAAKRTPTPEAIKALLPQLADIPVEAERKAKTEAELRTEIAELNRRLRASTTSSIAPEREKMLLERINALDGQMSNLKATAGTYEKAMSGIYAQAIVMAGAAKRIQETVDEVRGNLSDSVPGPKYSSAPTIIPSGKPVSFSVKVASGAVNIHANAGNKVRAGAERMLAVCAQWFPKGRTEAQVASQVQMKRTGGTWAAYKSDLKQGGYLEIRDGIWFATEAGVAYFGGSIPDAPQTTEEVFNLWTPKLRAGAVKMLSELIKHKGLAITREQLGEAVEMGSRGGTFSAYLSDLKTADLIVVAGSNLSANAETLFL